MKKGQGVRIAEAVQAVFAYFPGGLIVFDAESLRVLTMNDRARALLHYTEADEADLSIHDLVSQNTILENLIADCQRRGESQANISFISRKGSSLPAPLAATLTLVGNESLLLLRFADRLSHDDYPTAFPDNVIAQIHTASSTQRKPARLDSNSIKRMEIICSGFIIYSVMKELFAGQNAYVHYTLFPDKYNATDPRKIHYDLVVFAMPSVSRYEIDVVRELISYNRHLPILIVSMKVDDAQMVALIKSGVRGVIAEEKEFPHILTAANAIMKGELWCPRAVLQTILESGSIYGGTELADDAETNLSERELEILKLVAIGMKNGEVAEKLNISYSTVASHVYNIFRKLDIRSRAEAIHYALSHRMI